jgi:hypothetical protein
LDDEYFMIDGSIIRANQCAAGYNKGGGEDLGRSCGLKENGCVAIIPTRSSSKEKREIDKHLDKEQRLV